VDSKSRKQELERMPLTELTVFCKQVADNPKGYTEAGAAEADKLTRLVQTTTTVSPKSQRTTGSRTQAGRVEKADGGISGGCPLAANSAMGLRGKAA
jgi:hypothetical protein